MITTASTDVRTQADSRGARILVILIVVSTLLLAGYLLAYRTLKQEVVLDSTQFFREELPDFIDRVSLFQAKGGVVMQLFIPERNTRLHLILPDQPFTPPQAPSDLLEAIRSFRIRRETTPSLHPLILSFFSAQLDSRRSEREGSVQLHNGDEEVAAEQVASLKGDEHFLFSVFPFADRQIGVVGFTTKRPVTAADIQPALSALTERLVLSRRS